MLTWGYLQDCSVQAGWKGRNTARRYTSAHNCRVTEGRHFVQECQEAGKSLLQSKRTQKAVELRTVPVTGLNE